ncbi:MAG: hypothetical protein GY833_21940 [Aestuariibacter sp.]|nr:hypothetical protein [Aestuariibacter sp.]
MHGLHSREFLTIRRALSEAEALLAEGDLVSPSPKEENQPYFAEEQEPFFAEDMPAFYANPNSKTQPTLSAGAE